MKNLLLTLMLSIALVSCDLGIDGVGEVVSYSPSVGTFSSIDISIPAEINIEYAEVSELNIMAQSNIIDNMEIELNGKELSIEFDKNVDDHKTITLNLFMPALEDISISGACDVIVFS